MKLDNQPFDEITLRSYGSIGDLKGRDLIKKICLSCGLIQINDSRDILVDIFYVLILANSNKVWLSSKDIEIKVIDMRSEHNLNLIGVAGSNVRRILKQLMDFGFIERVSSKYRFIEFLHPAEIFEKIYFDKVERISNRIRTYFKKI